MGNYLWIGLGGALGSIARHWCSVLVAERFGNVFPWGTLFVNVSGSFIIGILAALATVEGPLSLPLGARQFLMVGICGGFTTFSSFSLQTLELLSQGRWLHAAGNILLSVLCCLLAVWLGYAFGAFAVKGS